MADKLLIKEILFGNLTRHYLYLQLFYGALSNTHRHMRTCIRARACGLRGSPSVSAPRAVIQCQERPSSQEQLFVCLSSSSLSIPLSYSSSESSLCSHTHPQTHTQTHAHVCERTHTYSHTQTHTHVHTQQCRMLHLFSHYRPVALFSSSFTCCSVSLSSLLASPL